MALLCPERLFACGAGLNQFRRHRPTRFINLTWREDYLGKGSRADRALAIAIWYEPCAPRCDYDVVERPVGPLFASAAE